MKCAIEAIHRADSLVLMDDGRVLPITHWFDDDGVQVTAECATWFVAGRAKFWVTGRVEDFNRILAN